MKKILSIFLCVIILLCFVACGEKSNTDKQSTEGTNQSESNSTENSITNTQSTESTNQNETDSIENTDHNTESTESTNENGTNNQEIAIFNTKNIKRITFYAYYGNGKGSDVPVEHLDEIITWLDSFTIDKEVPELIPPGTNTINVEIEYFDKIKEYVCIVNNLLKFYLYDLKFVYYFLCLGKNCPFFQK